MTRTYSRDDVQTHGDRPAWSDEQDDRASYNAEVPVDLAGAV